MPRGPLAASFDLAAATRNLPRVYSPRSQGLIVQTVAASASATFVTQIQAGTHFLLKRITAGYDRNDWSFNVNLNAYQRDLFDERARGADHFFGQFDTATAAPRWQGGYHFSPPVFVPANSNITISVTNGTAGILTISFALHGEDQTAG